MLDDALFKRVHINIIMWYCCECTGTQIDTTLIILWYFLQCIAATRGGGWTTVHLYAVHYTVFYDCELMRRPLEENITKILHMTTQRFCKRVAQVVPENVTSSARESQSSRIQCNAAKVVIQKNAAEVRRERTARTLRENVTHAPPQIARFLMASFTERYFPHDLTVYGLNSSEPAVQYTS